MCRFAAYVGAPISPAHLVLDGEHSLYEQSWAPKELLSGSVNADGYGVVWYGPNGPARIAEARPIWYDEDLRSTLGAVSAACMVAALRNATDGISVDRSGLLPLVHDQWSFVLNGFVPDFRASHMRSLRAGLSDELYAELRGSSDSETLFFLALEAVRGGATAVEALEQVARLVLERVGRSGEAQLNMLLSDGERVVVLRTGSQLVTNSLYFARRPPFAPDGVVIASEPLDPGAAWEAVDGHSWIEVGPDCAVRSEGFFV